MTDRQDTMAEQSGQVPDDIWRVEGSDFADYGDGGLGDTVVRIPRITDATTASGAPQTRSESSRKRPTEEPADAAGAGPSQAKAVPEAPTAVRPPAPEHTRPVPAVADRTQALPAPEPTQALPAPPAPEHTRPVPAVADRTQASPAPPAPVAAAVGPDGPLAATTAPAAAVPAAKPKASSHPRTRKARLRIAKVDAWSVMKTSFLFSIAFGIMVWVSVSVVWAVIVSSGVFDVVNQQIADLISSPTAQTTFRIDDYINTNKVLGVTALLAVVNVVISTALGTLAAFLYNLSANILGGLEVTLSED